MVQIFPERLRELWSEWEIRAMVLASLILQSILILIGNRRKHSTQSLLQFLLWSSYLSADWIATVALGVLSSYGDGNGDSTKPEHIIKAFWAPFLLLHLGGPDTITAYSLEDNELWWRHLVMLVVQVVVAFYILIRAWTGDNMLNFLSLPIYLAGIIKFGERNWVLRCASSKYFRKSMFPRRDPGPNYARFMGEYHSKRLEGFDVSSESNIEAPTFGDHIINVMPSNDNLRDVDNLRDAYNFFDDFKRLFADLILSFHDIIKSRSFVQNSNCDVVFKVIEIELGFIYDVFYTKAVVAYSHMGSFLRFISFLCTVVVFFAFLFIEKQGYRRLDISITYILLAGAVALEIYAVVLLLCSDRAVLWLSKQKNVVADSLNHSILPFLPTEPKRWSNKIAQFNLIRLCINDKPTNWGLLQKALCIYETMEMNRYEDFQTVSKELKELIFQQLRKKSRSAFDYSACKRLCSHRGLWVLEEEKCLDQLGWSIENAEFDQSILLWHIATDLCYYSGMLENSSDAELNEKSNFKEISKWLSDYMLYLLVMRPFMLPNGIGQIRFQDTRAEAEEFFRGRNSVKDAKKACATLLQVSTKILPLEVKGDRSKSVLFDACKLVQALRSLKWEKEKKWEMVSHVWVEMLSYAACQCQRSQHAQQLRQGGELLTHVWLLMAHLGITEQFQISKGHARAKLNVR